MEGELTKLEHRAFVRDCCVAFGVELETLLSPSREVPIVRARHVVVWLLRARYSLSFPTLARLVGRLDHTTAMNSHSAVNTALLRGSPWVFDLLERVRLAEITRVPLEPALVSLCYCRESELQAGAA